MILVDSNVLLDVIGHDPQWAPWSVARLDEARRSTGLGINPIIYAEIAPRFATVTNLDTFILDGRIEMQEFTRDVLFAAGVAHRRYRARGGEKDRVLPDFFIGAHAALTGSAILTRDPRRFRRDFPAVELITP